MAESTIQLPFVHTLEYPIQWGKDETITEIEINRRLKAKDLKGLPASSAIKMEHMIQLISRITAKPSALIEELDTNDLFVLTEVVMSFLPAGPETGGS
jgi:hypothetical protein